MTPGKLLQHFMPGDVVVEVQDDPNNTSGLIVVFKSGYQLICGTGWKWELPKDENSDIRQSID